MEKQFKKEVDEEVKKSHKKETIIAFVVLVILALLTFGGIYWYLSSDQFSVDTKNYTNYKKGSSGTNPTSSGSTKTDETAGWKTFTGSCGYSIKYPTNWVYKDYSTLPNGAPVVAFADKTSSLPPEQSDALGIIGVRCSDEELADNITTDPSKIQKETVTVDGKTVKKWTLLSGRTDDMYGDVKMVYVSVPAKNGKYVWATLYSETFTDIFTKMVNTITIK